MPIIKESLETEAVMNPLHALVSEIKRKIAFVILAFWSAGAATAQTFTGVNIGTGATGTDSYDSTTGVYTLQNEGSDIYSTLDNVQILPFGNYLSYGAISSGSYHTLYLQPNGYVISWGQNSYGQLGNGTTTQANSPVSVLNLSGIEAVSAIKSLKLQILLDE